MQGNRTIGVAIAIPEPYGRELQMWRERFGDPFSHAIPTHITLLPPTTVETDALEKIEDHLRAVAETDERFTIELRGTGTFRPASPVVFVELARGIGACERIAAKVRCGPLVRELEFPYHPHITVAHELPDDVLDLAYEELAEYRAEFSAWGFSLYEHGPDGVWRPQRDFCFGHPLPGPRFTAVNVGAVES